MMFAIFIKGEPAGETEVDEITSGLFEKIAEEHHCKISDVTLCMYADD